MNISRKPSNLKNLLASISLLCLVCLGCQSAGGDLLPLPGESIEIITSRFANDTAQITDNGVTVKLYGSWGGGNGLVMRVFIKNETVSIVKLNLDNFVLVNGKQKRETVSSVIDKTNDAVLTDKNIIIAAGDRRALRIRFSVPFGESLPNDEAEQTLYFTLPIEISGQTKIAREFKAVFKGIDQQVEFGKEPASDW